jgi:endonuclease/exonuclease/phosphatase family metal-dependent hydrolase
MKGKLFNIFNISVICEHEPTEDKEEEIKSAFYDKLDRLYLRVPKHDIKIIMGDMNAKIGKNHRVPYVGHHSLHDEFNNNGIMMTDFAVTRNLVISSTVFPHKNVLKETWISPDGRTRNQIDHVMLDARHARNITDGRSYRSADCNSDHLMVKLKYRARISIVNRTTGQRKLKYSTDNGSVVG